MKSRLLALGLIAAWVVGCSEPVSPTPTSIPASATNIVTLTSSPTDTPIPIETPTPSTSPISSTPDALSGAVQLSKVNSKPFKCGSRIYRIVYSPDAVHLASASEDTIYICNMDSLVLTIVVPIPQGKSLSGGVAWSPDGDSIAGGLDDGTVQIWNVDTGKTVSAFGQSKSNSVYDDVRSVAWSPNGTSVAAGYADGSVEIWEVQTGRELKTLSDERGGIIGMLNVAWSPDGKRFVGGGGYGSILIWDAETWEKHRYLSVPKPDDTLMSIAWSPSGDHIAAGSWWGYALIGNISDDESLIIPPEQLGASVETVAWSANGNLLASGSDDGKVKVWDLAKGKIVAFYDAAVDLNGDHIVYSIVWSPNGEQIIVAMDDEYLIFLDTTHLVAQ